MESAFESNPQAKKGHGTGVGESVAVRTGTVSAVTVAATFHLASRLAPNDPEKKTLYHTIDGA